MPDEKTVDNVKTREKWPLPEGVVAFDPMRDRAYTSRKGAHADFAEDMERNSRLKSPE